MTKNTIISSIIQACEKAFCSCIRATAINPDNLPLFLVGRYNLFSCKTEGGKEFVIFSPKQPQFPLMVKQIVGNAQRIEQLLGKPVLFVSDGLERYKRSRLRQQHFNFIITNMETNLPDWGIIRTEYAPEPKKIRPGLGFAAQRILLAHLNHLILTLTLSTLKELFGFSKVTGIAAFDELENTGLARREPLPETRGQHLVFSCAGRDLWDLALPHLHTPVRAKIGIDILPEHFEKISSGESALAAISMLNPPEQEVFAFFGSADEVAFLKKNAVPIEDARYLIELWKHPPLLPGLSKMDPLTTILTTRDIASDPRVEGEHDDILEKFKW